MTEMTYDEARGAVLEYTEMGYSVASQDKLWVCFIFDLTSEDEWYGNRLYPVHLKLWSYDMDGNCLVWTRRAEAEAFRLKYNASRENVADAPKMYVMNWGDDARFEACIIGRDTGAVTRRTPKFAGSREAWQAMVEQYPRTAAHYEELMASREIKQ